MRLLEQLPSRGINSSQQKIAFESSAVTELPLVNNPAQFSLINAIPPERVAYHRVKKRDTNVEGEIDQRVQEPWDNWDTNVEGEMDQLILVPRDNWISQVNDVVSIFLVQQQRLDFNEINTISKEQLVALALILSQADPHSKRSLISEMQWVNGNYGELLSEALSDNYQDTIIARWALNNLFSTTVERSIEDAHRDYIRQRDEQAVPFTVQDIKNHVVEKLSVLHSHDPDRIAYDFCWQYVKNKILPIFNFNDEHHNTLSVIDMEWGIKNVGLLYALSVGADVSHVNEKDALHTGLILLTQLGENETEGEWRFFLLPSMLLFSHKHPQRSPDRNGTPDPAVKARSLNDYILHYERLQDEKNPMLRYEQSMKNYRTRKQLAEEIINNRCPGLNVDTYINGGDIACRRSEHSEPYADPELLKDITREYEAQVESIAKEFAPMDNLLVVAAWDQLGSDEIDFIDNAQVCRERATFDAVDSIRSASIVSASQAAQKSMIVELARGVELFSASQEGLPERVYAMFRKTETQPYVVKRIDRDRQNYYQLLGDDTRPIDDLDFTLKFTHANNDVVKQRDENLTLMFENISTLHRQTFYQQLYDFGFEKTTLEHLKEYGLSLIPLYECFTDLRVGNELPCAADAISLLMPVAQLSSSITKIGRNVVTAAMKSHALIASEIILGQTLRQALIAVAHQLPGSAVSLSLRQGRQEVIHLAMSILRVFDPGFETVGFIGKKAARKIYALGERMTRSLPSLRSSWSRVNALVEQLPNRHHESIVSALSPIGDKKIDVIPSPGQKLSQKDLFVKIANNGEPFGPKFTIQEGKLRVEPSHFLRFLNNLRTQGLSGRGAARQGQRWAVETRTAVRTQDEINVGVNAHVNTGVIAGAPDTASLDQLATASFELLSTHPKISFMDDQLTAQVGGYIVPVQYMPSKNLFFSQSAKGTKEWIKYDPVKHTFVRLSDIELNTISSMKVTDAQRFQTLKRSGLDLGVSDNADVSWMDMDSNAQPIPKQVISLWVGNNPIPDNLIENINTNANTLKSIILPDGDKFTYKLYLSTESETFKNADLLKKLENVEIIALENSGFHQEFISSKYYPQYQAAIRGNADLEWGRTHYASAADIVRYQLLKREGGIYVDIDDTFTGVFKDVDLRATNGQLILGGLVNNEALGMKFKFNNDIFGTHSGNPTLDKISDAILSRFENNPDFYTRWTKNRESDYANQLSDLTGPKVFNNVISTVLPVVNQYRNTWLLLNSIPESVRTDEIFAAPLLLSLARKLEKSYVAGFREAVNIGASHSWRTSRAVTNRT